MKINALLSYFVWFHKENKGYIGYIEFENNLKSTLLLVDQVKDNAKEYIVMYVGVDKEHAGLGLAMSYLLG